MPNRSPTHARHFFTAAIGAAIAIATPGAASANDFIGIIDNNWFDPANWSDGALPDLLMENAIIKGGPSVTATSADAGGASAESFFLEIGNDSTSGQVDSLTSEVDVVTTSNITVGGVRNVQGDMDGRLTIDNADLQVGAFLEIGKNSESINSTANGAVSITNGSITLSNASPNNGGLRIGLAFQGGGNATGALSVSNGDITDTSGGPWQIGVSIQGSPGIGTGSLILEDGTLSHQSTTEIGRNIDNSAGADGELRLINSDGDLGDLSIGTGDNAAGLLSLEQSLLSVDSLLEIGDGATFAFGLGGNTRAAAGAVGTGTYGALDVSDTNTVTTLNGTLSVSFDFTPVSDSLFFDLIALADGSTFSGSFDQINYIGLPNGYNVQHQIIAASGGNGEIFRITASVPVPATAGLSVLGLLGLAGIGGLRRWRGGQQRDGAAAG